MYDCTKSARHSPNHEGNMAKVVYYVSADATGWRITYNGTDYRCGSEQAALEAAVEAAHGSGKLGYDAIVVVHEPDGGWKTRWAYGHCPYPLSA
jgi:hypothetical protein